jgi:hypothetical protein
MNIVLFILFNIVFIFIIIYQLKKNNKNNNNKKLESCDNKFYPVSTFPELENIYFHKDNIHSELKNLLNDYKFTDNIWNDWPELELYDSKKDMWKIMPFFYYDYWVENNCNKMPSLTKFLKSLPNLKIALLSVLSPHTRLNEHQGWGNHSNKVLRCHYGLVIPDDCFITVRDENDILGQVQYHIKDKWMIFDDSKHHFAANNSDKYRIVLIIDLDRPNNIKKGSSQIGDTKELLDIIEYIKKNDIKNSVVNSNQLDVLNKNLLSQNDLVQQTPDKI